jgi:ribonuclease P protein subunit RPR2
MVRSDGRAKAKIQRRENAIKSQEHLTSIIMETSMPMLARRGAAKHLVKTSSRNRLPLPPKQRHWICRGCTVPLLPGVTARVRIKAGQRITTCLECGRIRRLGGGPGYHRRIRDD